MRNYDKKCYYCLKYYNLKLLLTPNQRNSEVLNDHYINIVERSCEEKPASFAKQSYLTDDIKIVDHIIRHYEDHPSVRHL